MTPTIQALVSRPCRSCGGTEFSYIPRTSFSNPSRSYTFAIVACRQCRTTDLFAELSDLEEHQDHQILRAPVAPFR